MRWLELNYVAERSVSSFFPLNVDWDSDVFQPSRGGCMGILTGSFSSYDLKNANDLIHAKYSYLKYLYEYSQNSGTPYVPFVGGERYEDKGLYMDVHTLYRLESEAFILLIRSVFDMLVQSASLAAMNLNGVTYARRKAAGFRFSYKRQKMERKRNELKLELIGRNLESDGVQIDSIGRFFPRFLEDDSKSKPKNKSCDLVGVLKPIFLGGEGYSPDETGFLSCLNSLSNSVKHSFFHRQNKFLFGCDVPTLISYHCLDNRFDGVVIYHNHNLHHFMMGYQDNLMRVLWNMVKFWKDRYEGSPVDLINR